MPNQLTTEYGFSWQSWTILSVRMHWLLTWAIIISASTADSANIAQSPRSLKCDLTLVLEPFKTSSYKSMLDVEWKSITWVGEWENYMSLC